MKIWDYSNLSAYDFLEDILPTWVIFQKPLIFWSFSNILLHSM